MSVLFLDLKAAYEELRSDFDSAHRRVMDSGWYLLGREIEAFEDQYVRAQTGYGAATASNH